MDCLILLDNFPGKLLLPDSDRYTTNKISYFATFENEVSPAFLIQPTDAQEVSDIISCARSALFTGDNRTQFRAFDGPDRLQFNNQKL